MRAFSRFSPALLLAAFAAAGAMPARAQESGPPGVPTEAAAPARPESREARLDRLFGELKREPNADKATALANQIQAAWLGSGSATVDLLMLRSTEALARKDTAAALDLTDQAIVLKPDYAEAYNRRATLHYARDEYALSIADVEETLAREPRHFGALAGLGAMLEEMGRDREAMDAYGRALAIYPTLKPAQDAFARLAEELSGQPA